MQIFSLVFLAVYILAKNIAPTEIHINNYLIQVVVYTLAAFSLWNVVDMFVEQIKPRAIYRRSFAIYAMHLPISIVILKILDLYDPQNQWLEIPKFIIMVALTLVIVNSACAVLEKFTPKIYAVLTGKQIKKSK